MSNSFFSLHQAISDKNFIKSVIFSISCVAVIVTSVVVLLKNDRINIIPIANIESISPASIQANSATPFSQIVQIVNITQEREMPARHVFSGYLLNIKEFCKVTSFKDVKESILLVKTGTQYAAGRGIIRPDTCVIADNLRNDQQIFVVSDVPFSNPASEKRYFELQTIN
jgi:hypothetical protein